jgi:hypothetical protein
MVFVLFTHSLTHTCTRTHRFAFLRTVVRFPDADKCEQTISTLETGEAWAYLPGMEGVRGAWTGVLHVRQRLTVDMGSSQCNTYSYTAPPPETTLQPGSV